jgi:hypothetical protein
MNADQNKAVRLALDYLQQTTKQFTPSDAWTDADWAIWRKANPLQDQMDTISREILADSKGSKFMEVGRQMRFTGEDSSGYGEVSREGAYLDGC